MKRLLNIETKNSVGKTVKVSGFIDSVRVHGKTIFFDLRDKSGFLQVVFTSSNKELYSLVQKVRPQFVVEITGKVSERPDKMVNPNLQTGTVELQGETLNILSEAKTPPFEIDKDTIVVNEETRLRYRYLDLRTERMKKNLFFRSQVTLFIRNYLNKEGFTEIQTPILSKSTPEGARDYLVPSRLNPGKFFALPQSPQQYKQLLMIAGFEKYFQIAPCFRDEDARADRSPGEFYQLDIEMSFIEQEDILNLIENLYTKMVESLFPEKHFTFKPWPRLKYEEVMEKYGSDKPDLRKDKNDKNELAFAFVVDFPLFKAQTADDYFHGSGKAKFAPSHHMFTLAKKEDIELLDKDPLKVKSYQHDLVLNGYEVGGGSIRIHDPKVQEKIFDLIGFNKEQKERFSYFLEAFKYGAPPHGGIASGLERLMMILMGEPNLREVMAFPLTGDGRDPMTGAPSQVFKEQLEDLKIKIERNEKL
jgi:aspartyl-tRNA synthetase